jgi:hypothetical protein
MDYQSVAGMPLERDEFRLRRSGDRSLLPLPACGERVGVRGTLDRLGLAESPPHPDRKNDPTSPRKRGEVTELAHAPIQLRAIML